MNQQDYAELIEIFQRAVLERVPEAGGNIAIAREGFPGEEQMRAYIHSYHIRLRNVLENDYPALKHYLGEEEFFRLAQGYVLATPSRHYNLNRYAIAFSAFVKQHHANAFSHDIAQLESALCEVYQAPDSTALGLADVRQLPQNYLLDTPLTLREASYLLALDHNAGEYLEAFRQNIPVPTPEPEPYYCFIWRHENHMRRQAVEYGAYRLLTEIRNGLCLAEALEKILGTLDAAQTEAVSECLQAWLGGWLQEGYFRK